MDPGLLRELSIWHAVHDDRDTGLTERERGYALHLAERRHAVVGGHVDPGTRWAPLVHDIDPRILRDPQWPLLAATIEKAARIGHDPILILPRLLNDQPLPDSKIAAAAMYRLVHAIPEALPDSKPTRYEHAVAVPVLRAVHPGARSRPRHRPLTPFATETHSQ